MLQNRLIIIGKHYKNKIYETSKNKWIIELNGNKLNNKIPNLEPPKLDNFFSIWFKNLSFISFFLNSI